MVCAIVSTIDHLTKHFEHRYLIQFGIELPLALAIAYCILPVSNYGTKRMESPQADSEK